MWCNQNTFLPQHFHLIRKYFSHVAFFSMVWVSRYAAKHSAGDFPATQPDAIRVRLHTTCKLPFCFQTDRIFRQKTIFKKPVAKSITVMKTCFPKPTEILSVSSSCISDNYVFRHSFTALSASVYRFLSSVLLYPLVNKKTMDNYYHLITFLMIFL